MKRIFFASVLLLLFALPSFSAYSNATLNGSYVFSFNAFSGGVSVAVAGYFQADGNGNVVSGVLDQNGPGTTLVTQSAFTGFYSIDTSGRGRLQLSTSGGTKAIAFAMVSSDGAKLIHFDNTTGSGEIERRTVSSLDNSSLNGSYVFLLEGGAPSNGWRVAAGRFTANGAGTITAGVEDLNDNRVAWRNVSFGGSYSVAANGRGTATFNLAVAPGQLSFYPVSASKVKFLALDSSGGIAGDAELQDSGGLSNASFSGSYALIERGQTNGWWGMVGNFNANGNGGISNGLFDSNEAGSTPLWNNAFTGAYLVASNGRCPATIATSFGSWEYVFYLVSRNKLKYVVLVNGQSSGGIVEAQQGIPLSTASFQGTFGFSSFGFQYYAGVPAGWYELATLGYMIGDGNGNETGTEDSNWSSDLQSATPFSGTSGFDAQGIGWLSTYANYSAYAVSPARIFYLFMGTGAVLTGTMDRLGPYVPPAGVVNAASYAAGGLIPGSIVSLFGVSLAPSAEGATSSLPPTLNGVTVTLNGVKAPLFYVSPSQINAQVPWELTGQSQATLLVLGPDFTSAPQVLTVSPVSPGIFIFTADGHGAVRNAFSPFQVAIPAGMVPGVDSGPVAREGYISIYCTGLGTVSNQPGTGVAAPAFPNPLAETPIKPMVEFGSGGIQVQAIFSGLAPGFVGLYQVDVQIPANAPTGSAVPIRVLMGAQASNAVTIAIQ